MISAFLFDFGGTLDSDGGHWLDRFFLIYQQIGLGDLPKTTIKEAFYWADAQAEVDPGMRKADLRTMMVRHVSWQFEKMGLKNPEKAIEAANAFIHPTERVLHRNRHILERMHQNGYKMGIISNFYGNVETLCHEFGLRPFLQIILDSTQVGMKKPDPRLFEQAAHQLKLSPSRIGFVGDSFERDIRPAKKCGMKTFWMVGDPPPYCPDPSQVDVTILSLDDLLQHAPKHSLEQETV